MRMAVNGPVQSVSGEAIGLDYRAFVIWKPHYVRDSNSVSLRTQSRSISHRAATSPNSVHKIRKNLYLYTAVTLLGLRIDRLCHYLESNDRKRDILRQHRAAVQTNHHRQIHTKNTTKVIVLCFCVYLT
jgi:hypothetical protein